MPGAGEERVEDPGSLAGHEKTQDNPQLESGQPQQDDGDEDYLVDWASQDKDNPHNWSTPYRSWLTFQLGMLALAASSASAIIAPANLTIARYLGVGQEVVTLNISLYV